MLKSYFIFFVIIELFNVDSTDNRTFLSVLIVHISLLIICSSLAYGTTN